jgi:hypothetical protein
MAFHYNHSENFVPTGNRTTPLGDRIPAPTGESEDYGFSLFLFEQKVVAKFNWYKGGIINSDQGNFNSLMNSTIGKGFQWLGNLESELRLADPDGDGINNDPDTYPNFDQALPARIELEELLRLGGLWEARNAEWLPDGTISTQADSNVADTVDVEARGFEAQLILNPTREWRVSLNVAKQETVLDNISPFLTDWWATKWGPFLDTYGDQDFSNPVSEDANQSVADRLAVEKFEFLKEKFQEGRPNVEVRPWRFNLVTRYQFSEGILDGFATGGAYRWQKAGAIGYPSVEISEGGESALVPDIENAIRGDSESNMDLFFSYRRNIFEGKVNWRIQLNVKNVLAENDDVLVLRAQPNGDPARVRTAPPREFFLTNSFSW